MEPTDYRNSLIDNLLSYGDIGNFLLEQGYFPENWVIPPFLEINLRTGVSDTNIREPLVLYTPKDDTAWRDFSIVHPSNYESVVKKLTEDTTLNALEVLYKSPNKIISYSVPSIFSSQGVRAANQISQWSELQDDILLHSGRYGYNSLVIADIANCYHTLYSHSIEWAFSEIGMTTLGAEIDKALRRGVKNRTHGIPVGPYASDFVAEVVLCGIDSKLEKNLGRLDYIGFRYKDNYYFLCRNEAGANRILQNLAIELRESHLVLNTQKTSKTDVNSYFSSFWQSDFAALKSSFNLSDRPESTLETINIHTLNAIVRAFLKLSAKYGHQKAIIDKSINFLSRYRPFENDYKVYFYTLASLLDIRSSAFPKVFNLLQKLVQEQPGLFPELKRLSLQLIKRASEDRDDFLLCWLAYLLSESKDTQINHAINSSTSRRTGLVGVANDYLKFVQSGVRPTDDPLWRHSTHIVNNSSIEFSQKVKLTEEELYEHLKVKFAES